MRRLGKLIIRYPEVTSTNKVIKELALDNIEAWTVVVADVQTAGRGRMDRSWESPEGGLWLSVLMDVGHDLDQQKFGLIPLMSGVAVATAIKRAFDLDARVKWPNDVLINGRKVCGILGELVDVEDKKLAIVGIGVNVKNPVKEGYEFSDASTSVGEELGEAAELECLEAAILEDLDSMADLLINGNYETILASWRETSSTLGHKVRVTSPGGAVEGIARDIDENGSLLVETESGLQKVLAGDCEIISD